MVHAPERSFGSVLTTGLGCMSGFNAEMSSSPVSGAGAAAAVFLPKILESRVAIVQFSLKGSALRIRDADAHLRSRYYLSVDMDLVVCARPAEIVFFNQNILNRPDER